MTKNTVFAMAEAFANKRIALASSLADETRKVAKQVAADKARIERTKARRTRLDARYAVAIDKLAKLLGDPDMDRGVAKATRELKAEVRSLIEASEATD